MLPNIWSSISIFWTRCCGESGEYLPFKWVIKQSNPRVKKYWNYRNSWNKNKPQRNSENFSTVNGTSSSSFSFPDGSPSFRRLEWLFSVFSSHKLNSSEGDLTRSTLLLYVFSFDSAAWDIRGDIREGDTREVELMNSKTDPFLARWRGETGTWTEGGRVKERRFFSLLMRGDNGDIPGESSFSSIWRLPSHCEY